MTLYNMTISSPVSMKQTEGNAEAYTASLTKQLCCEIDPGIQHPAGRLRACHAVPWAKVATYAAATQTGHQQPGATSDCRRGPKHLSGRVEFGAVDEP
jgi:hypothetical protein